MAIKNNSLDSKIISSAEKEFLEHGFLKASLRKIAKNAGITTGALYTRYENKDDLFYNIIKDIFEIINIESQLVINKYNKVQKSRSIDDFITAIKYEEGIYLDIIFKHYNKCVLLFCKSEGSAVQEKWNKLMEVKKNNTIEFICSVSQYNVSYEEIDLLLSSQFYSYYWILQKGLDEEKTRECIKTTQLFFEAGWRDLLIRIL